MISYSIQERKVNSKAVWIQEPHIFDKRRQSTRKCHGINYESSADSNAMTHLLRNPSGQNRLKQTEGANFHTSYAAPFLENLSTAGTNRAQKVSV